MAPTYCHAQRARCGCDAYYCRVLTLDRAHRSMTDGNFDLNPPRVAADGDDVDTALAWVPELPLPGQRWTVRRKAICGWLCSNPTFRRIPGRCCGSRERLSWPCGVAGFRLKTYRGFTTSPQTRSSPGSATWTDTVFTVYAARGCRFIAIPTMPKRVHRHPERSGHDFSMVHGIAGWRNPDGALLRPAHLSAPVTTAPGTCSAIRR